MDNRSREEIRYHCSWLAQLGCLSLERLVRALNEGDRRGAMDACFLNLPNVPDHASEYDHGYFHGNDRLAGDLKKTNRMLTHADLLVCRVRVGAPELPMQHPRLVVAHAKTKNEAVSAMSKEFSGHVRDPVTRLRLLRGQPSKTEIDSIAHEFFMWTDAKYKYEIEEIAEIAGKQTALALHNTSGVVSRLGCGLIPAILRRLMAAPYNVKKLETFMCGGVAARFDDETALFGILDRLMAAPYNVKKLETFMCDGVAARFDDETALFGILDRLMAAPYNVKKLETFMCGGVAARFDDDEFLAALCSMPILNKSRAAQLCKDFPLGKAKRAFLPIETAALKKVKAQKQTDAV
jgi:hypothetical protein